MNPFDRSPIVVKVGGSEGIDLDALCDDIAGLWHDSIPLVLVHGGSAETNSVAEALGSPPRFVTSPSGFTSRHTDRRTLPPTTCGVVWCSVSLVDGRTDGRDDELSGLDEYCCATWLKYLKNC